MTPFKPEGDARPPSAPGTLVLPPGRLCAQDPGLGEPGPPPMARGGVWTGGPGAGGWAALPTAACRGRWSWRNGPGRSPHDGVWADREEGGGQQE